MASTKTKDPAFLWYPKDWLQGTAELTPAEKGVYVDLLCHQHQSGDLPFEPARIARLAGLSLDEFTPIWEVLQSKFEAIDTSNGKRLVNRKLIQVVSDRKESALKTKKNRIIGIFGGCCRNSKSDGVNESVIAKIKEIFNPDDFMTVEEAKISERLSEWYKRTLNECLAFPLPSLGIGNAVGNEDVSSSLVLSSSLPKNKEIDFASLPNDCDTQENREALYLVIGSVLYELEQLSVDLSNPKVRALFPWFAHLKRTGRSLGWAPVKELIKRSYNAPVEWITHAVSHSISNDYAGLIPFTNPSKQSNRKGNGANIDLKKIYGES